MLHLCVVQASCRILKLSVQNNCNMNFIISLLDYMILLLTITISNVFHDHNIINVTSTGHSNVSIPTLFWFPINLISHQCDDVWELSWYYEMMRWHPGTCQWSASDVQAPGDGEYTMVLSSHQVLTSPDNNVADTMWNVLSAIRFSFMPLRVKDAHILTDSVRNENILNVNYIHYNKIYTSGVLTVECINIHNYTEAVLHNKTANKNSALIPGLWSSLLGFWKDVVKFSTGACLLKKHLIILILTGCRTKYSVLHCLGPRTLAHWSPGTGSAAREILIPRVHSISQTVTTNSTLTTASYTELSQHNNFIFFK